MGWEMLREDKQDMISAEKHASDEIREWRQEQTEGMKALITEKEQRMKIEELVESKAYQDFKRECKQGAQEDERQQHSETYLQSLENAAWLADRSHAGIQEEKEL